MNYSCSNYDFGATIAACVGNTTTYDAELFNIDHEK